MQLKKKKKSPKIWKGVKLIGDSREWFILCSHFLNDSNSLSWWAEEIG